MLSAEQIGDALRDFKQSGKPLITSMSSSAASGGYWIGMLGNPVIADAETLTGSIGIGGFFPTFERSLAHLGVHTDGVGTTRWSGAMRLDRTLTPAAKQLVQSSVNHGYEQFVDAVAEARDLEIDLVRKLAEGRVWTGNDALKAGLVDELGGFQVAVKAAAKAAKLTNYQVDYVSDPTDWRSAFAAELVSTTVGLTSHWRANSFTPTGVMPSLWQKIQPTIERNLTTLLAMDDPHHVYAWCWCDVQ
ncbi:MAG: S49 family peptidase [Gammaproteobacteria bacterium]|nr:S49 family peptidase [Gammaproteobacteria bacterium]